LRATFLVSAASASDFPATGLPEIAMAGRSNVGKSSLINALVKQKVARTSAAPGKTRLGNYYLVEMDGTSRQPLYLVDLPGYGYARGGSDAMEAFGELTRQYFDPLSKPGRKIGGVLHLIDARHPALSHDAQAHEWLLRRGVPVAIIATKMDKLNRAEQRQALRAFEAYGTLVIPSSVETGLGHAAVWKTVREWAESA
jgi:GTP-binding protein